MKVYEGPAVIAERTKAALVLVRIEGVEFTPFSRLAGKVRRRLFPKIPPADSSAASPHDA
jgi:acyl-[acyl-carrier-protein]-phospholipid O-acyltransferase/long-chain-fatty-acid--[acyl-carrier-protein] ligase